MRLYSRAELEDELRKKWRLTKVGEGSATTSLWRTPKGKHLLVPDLPAGEPYPDYIVDKIVEQLDAFDENPVRR